MSHFGRILAPTGFSFSLLQLLILLKTHNSIARVEERETIIAETKYGKVEGEVFVVNDGKAKVNGFRGIRFAKAPLRELRFKPPEPPVPWADVRKTNRWPPACMQTPIFGDDPMQSSLPESEDCLFLNVFAPSEKSADFPNGYPIMLFIHGGGSNVGSTVVYGAKGITEKLVPKKIIFVGIQYRLGPYGFLSTADEVAPGNWGLLDMVAALKWVKDNIAAFGGDPHRITVVGQSAGGGATSLLMLSPLSRDLFQQGIAMSGAATAAWSLNEKPREALHRLAVGLDCDLPSYQQMVDCLRTKPVEDFRRILLTNRTETARRPQEFGPCMDGYFMPKIPSLLFAEAPPKPFIGGTTSLEFGLMSSPLNEWQETKWVFRNPESFSLSNFTAFLHEVVPDNLFKNAQKIREAALVHYLAKGSKHNNTFLFQQYNQVWLYQKMQAKRPVPCRKCRLYASAVRLGGSTLMNDFWFSVPQYTDAILRFQHSCDVWLYEFDYYNHLMFPRTQKLRGAYHLYDLTYLFDTQLVGHFDHDENDSKMMELFSTLWTNFVKFGNPTPKENGDIIWDKLSKADRSRFLRLNLNPWLRMDSGYAQREVQFWTNTVSNIELQVTDDGEQNAVHTEL